MKKKKKPKDSITSSEDYIVYENKISAQVKLLFLQFWRQFLQLRREAWKIQDSNDPVEVLKFSGFSVQLQKLH